MTRCFERSRRPRSTKIRSHCSFEANTSFDWGVHFACRGRTFGTDQTGKVTSGGTAISHRKRSFISTAHIISAQRGGSNGLKGMPGSIHNLANRNDRLAFLGYAILPVILPTNRDELWSSKHGSAHDKIAILQQIGFNTTPRQHTDSVLFSDSQCR